jgi:adenylate kinase family enzyme
MERILILGISGSGKTTLARRLHEILPLPIHFLDLYFWLPGWNFPDGESWFSKIHEISDTNRWIIEGNYESALEILIPRADTIVLMHVSRFTALLRILKRTTIHLNKPRDDRPKGCAEKIDWEFIKYIWKFEVDRKPSIESAIERLGGKSDLILLKNSREVERFYQRIISKS